MSFRTNNPNLSSPVEGRYESAPADESKPIQEQTDTDREDRRLLDMTREAYDESTTWFDTSVRRQMDDALRHFHSQHAASSKYNHDYYKKKSRIFRPKTRSAIRKFESEFAIAMFSTEDVVSVGPVNDADEWQRAAAEIHDELLNYRLKQRNQIPWFPTCMAGAQQAITVGIVISRQEWLYETRERPYTIEDAETGAIIDTGYETVVTRNRPNVELVAPENLRFSPAAAWYDPINTSPYVIERIPMYVKDIRKQMETPHQLTGAPLYRQLSDGILTAYNNQDWDSIRTAREENQLDRYEAKGGAISDYTTVWVYRNFMEVDGEDVVFDTLGTEIMLSAEPRPLEELYAHGMRPYVYGFSILEGLTLYPSGIPKLSSEIQKEANDIANLRIDNIRMAINKRYKVRRGGAVDMEALRRNVAGGAIRMKHPDDVKEMLTSDVTGSSYQEQDRLNLDMDEITGAHSASTVASSRALSETVGGMAMARADARPVSSYMMTTIIQTWVEPVLNQLVALEAAYEDDPELLNQVAGKTGWTIEQIMQVIQEPVMVTADVGLQATDPNTKLQKFVGALGAIAQLKPDAIQQADGAEIIREIMGITGYRDGDRFFPALSQDETPPQVLELQQQVQQLQQIIQTKQIEQQGKVEVARVNQETQLMRAKMDAELKLMLTRADFDKTAWLKQIEDRISQVDAALKVEESRRKRLELSLEREALSHTILQADREYALKMQQMARSNQREDIELSGSNGAMDLPGRDEAGTISREQYGMLPDSSL